MKNNGKKNDLMTKKYLDKKLKDSLKESKEYSDKRFERLFKYLDSRFEPLEKLAKDIYKFQDSVLKTLDF